MLTFDWSAAKARANPKKHSVSFEEAQSVFYDEYARQFFDAEHADVEEHFIMLGMSNRLRVLVVCHCERTGDVIRIISARRATAREQSYYDGPTL